MWGVGRSETKAVLRYCVLGGSYRLDVSASYHHREMVGQEVTFVCSEKTLMRVTVQMVMFR